MRQKDISARILAPAALVALLAPAALSRAQNVRPSPSSLLSAHSIVVIGANRPAFEALVERDFPGVSQLTYFNAVEPLLAIVHNNTRRVVKAYAVQWAITKADGSTKAVYLTLVNGPAGDGVVTGQTTVLGHTGTGFEAELVSPFFDWPRRDFPTLLKIHSVMIDLQTAAESSLISTLQGVSIRASLDGAIFGDGVCVGPDTSKLFERFEAEQRAEADEAQWILSQLKAGTTDQQLSDALSEQIYKGRNTTSVDSASLYATARGEEASRALGVLKEGGQTALESVAMQLASSSPLTLKRQAGK
jgi:hypothetical protein